MSTDWEYAEPQHRVFFYTVKDAALALGISKSSIYEHVAAGDIESRKYGRKMLLPAREVERLAQLIDGGATKDSVGS